MKCYFDIKVKKYVYHSFVKLRQILAHNNGETSYKMKQKAIGKSRANNRIPTLRIPKRKQK